MDESIKEGKKETQKEIKAREEKSEEGKEKEKRGKAGRKGRVEIGVSKKEEDERQK